MTRLTRKFLPPDGGWGWMVCLGSSLITLSLRSLDPSFGLLFGDLLEKLNVKTTGASVITGTADGIVNFSGMFVGPLVKKIGFRKMAICGSLLSFTGLMLTSQANSLSYIICTYSIVAAFGTGLATASGIVSLNTYFKKKRNQAVGFSMAGTTVGMMCMPQIIHLLLSHYDFHGALLIISGISLHAVVGSCLLQPVSWHMVPAPVDEIELEMEKDALLINGNNEREEMAEREVFAGTKPRKISNVDLSTNCLKNENQVIDNKKLKASMKNEEINKTDKKKIKKTSILEKLVSFFDLDLLKEPKFLNILIGLSLYHVAESNFKMITPFFLSSVGMARDEIAFCLSLTAFADVIARLTIPTLVTKLKFMNRNVFWASSVLIGISRSIMAEQMPGIIFMVNLVFNGLLRGVTMTSFHLIVAESCNIEKLPAAYGMMMVSKGLFNSTLGPLIGYIRDSSKSYKLCIHSMTFFIMFCSLTWGLEFMVNKISTRRRRSKSEKKFVSTETNNYNKNINNETA